MDAWAGGDKYTGRVSFVCVSTDGPTLASRFARELKLSSCTLTYTEDEPAWGQLGCSGFILLDGDGRVTCRASKAYLEVKTSLLLSHVKSKQV